MVQVSTGTAAESTRERVEAESARVIVEDDNGTLANDGIGKGT